MKKAAHSFALSLGIMAAFFIAVPAHAQTGHFVLISQGQLGAQTAYDRALHDYSVEIGTGYSGTTTGAFIAISGHNGTTGNLQRVDILGYSSASYSSLVTDCTWSDGNRAAGFYSATSTNPFYQLDKNDSGTPGDCVLNPSLWYKIGITVEFNSGVDYFDPGSVAGRTGWVLPVGWSSTTTLDSDTSFFPYFSVVADGFQITPNASSSGLFLSGALDFCNGVFASSSAPGIVTDLGIGLCDAGGFLFIPTAQSMQQYADLPRQAQNVIPFSYFYGLASLFQSSLTASSTQNFPTYSFSLATIDFASSTSMGHIFPSSLEFLSSTTISKFLPVGMHDLLYNLMIFVIWVDVAFVLYHKVVPKKAKV